MGPGRRAAFPPQASTSWRRPRAAPFGEGLVRLLERGTPLADAPAWELQDLLERSLASAADDGVSRNDALPAAGCLTGASR